MKLVANQFPQKSLEFDCPPSADPPWVEKLEIKVKRLSPSSDTP